MSPIHNNNHKTKSNENTKTDTTTNTKTNKNAKTNNIPLITNQNVIDLLIIIGLFIVSDNLYYNSGFENFKKYEKINCTINRVNNIPISIIKTNTTTCNLQSDYLKCTYKNYCESLTNMGICVKLKGYKTDSPLHIEREIRNSTQTTPYSNSQTFKQQLFNYNNNECIISTILCPTGNCVYDKNELSDCSDLISIMQNTIKKGNTYLNTTQTCYRRKNTDDHPWKHDYVYYYLHNDFNKNYFHMSNIASVLGIGYLVVRTVVYFCEYIGM